MLPDAGELDNGTIGPVDPTDTDVSAQDIAVANEPSAGGGLDLELEAHASRAYEYESDFESG